MVSRRLALALVCLSSAASLVHAETRGVIELFTSQGCSSCPAADKLIGELASDPSLVAISVPIDYWDYLGWKDTLATPKHTARQRAYARMRGDREVYTPQAVVNGMVHVLGSDRAAIEQTIAQSKTTPATLSVPVAVSLANNELTIGVTEAKDSPARGEVWLCALASAMPVAIGRGENRG